MAGTYTSHTWAVGDQPTAQQFNEMEAGIAEAVGAVRNIKAQSEDNITPGTTALTTGAIILVYE